MKKNNIFTMALISILLVGSIYVYFLNNNKIKDYESKSTSLNTQLQTLKKQSDALSKTNAKLTKDNAELVQKTNELKSK